MLQVNQERFESVVQDDFNRTSNTRWQAAIVRAKQSVESNPYVEFDGRTLLMLSADSLEVYEVTPAGCRNEAGRPCGAHANVRQQRTMTPLLLSPLPILRAIRVHHAPRTPKVSSDESSCETLTLNLS